MEKLKEWGYMKMAYFKRRRVSYHSGKAFLKIVFFISFFMAFLPTGITENKMDDPVMNTTFNAFQHSIDKLLVVSYVVDDTIVDENTGQIEYTVFTAYTIFGIPYAEVVTTDESSYINKKYLFTR